MVGVETLSFLIKLTGQWYRRHSRVYETSDLWMSEQGMSAWWQQVCSNLVVTTTEAHLLIDAFCSRWAGWIFQQPASNTNCRDFLNGNPPKHRSESSLTRNDTIIYITFAKISQLWCGEFNLHRTLACFISQTNDIQVMWFEHIWRIFLKKKGHNSPDFENQ
jgi:hypothetical protein